MESKMRMATGKGQAYIQLPHRYFTACKLILLTLDRPPLGRAAAGEDRFIQHKYTE